MNKVFAGEINYFILVSLDDILIYNSAIEEHWDHLQCALEILRQAKLWTFAQMRVPQGQG